MVYYAETSEHNNKRMAAGYYLFLCLIGFAIFLGPTGAGIPITLIGNPGDSHEFASPTMGTEPDDCQTCHPNQYGNWTATGHATHMTENGTHVRIGAYAWFSYSFFNSSCAECHTSGWDNSTGTPSYDALGVNCFACHSDTEPYVDYTGDSCGTCHAPSGEEHPHQFVAWQESAHANSLTDLRSSDHAASYCMHCMSSEAFIHQQNPDMVGTDVDTDFDPDGDFNSISCPTCHAVHANWSTTSPGMIRAVNATELCALCHVGSRHDMYNIWYGGPHHLAEVECTDCHGYDIAPGDNVFLNHSFAVDPEIACGQSVECHEGMEEWAIGQLEMIQDSFDALVEELTTEADELNTLVATYNATAGANITLANALQEKVDAAYETIDYLEADRSSGFHNPAWIMEELNAAYVDLLDAKATFYADGGGGGVVAGLPADMLIIIVGAAGGVALGLVLGILVGRRR